MAIIPQYFHMPQRLSNITIYCCYHDKNKNIEAIFNFVAHDILLTKRFPIIFCLTIALTFPKQQIPTPGIQLHTEK